MLGRTHQNLPYVYVLKTRYGNAEERVPELEISSKQREGFVKGNRTITVVCNKELRELELQFVSNSV